MMKKTARITGQVLYAIALVVLFITLLLVSGVRDSGAGGPRTFTKGKLVETTIAVLYAHHEIHACQHFTTVRNVASLGNGSKMQLIFNTPASTPTDDNDIHMFIIARGSGEGMFEIWEGPTVSDIGTAMSEENRRQQCSNTAQLEVTHTPTISNAGIHLAGFDRHFGSGQNVGGESRGINEIIFKRNTLYLINGISEAATNDFTIEPDWYEDSGAAP